jgi:hypothetical protein
MKIVLRLAFLAFIVAAGIWLWTILFPSPEKIVRSRLAEIARDASFKSDESPLATMAAAEEISACFSTNAEIAVQIPGSDDHNLTGRGEITQGVVAAHSVVGELKMEFLDVNVAIAPDRNSATADLTIRITSPPDKESTAEEMKFSFKKIDGDWLITRVETVRVLT